MIRARVGLLVPYVDYYEAIALIRDQKIRFAQRIAERLRCEFDVIDAGLVTNEDAAHRAAKLFADHGVNAIVVAPAVAAFAALPWAAVREVKSPVCIWQIQPDAQLGPEYALADLIRNSGGLGAQALANTMTRAGRTFRFGFSAAESDFPQNLRVTIEAAAVWRSLQHVRLGRIGDQFDQMIDIGLDASKWPGAPISEVPGAQVLSVFERQPAASVALRESEILRSHEVVELTADELARSARLSLAIDTIVTEQHLDAGSFNCHGANCLQHPQIGVTACYGVSRQTSLGRPFTCTGDLPTAIAMKILQDLNGWVLYAELDFVDESRGLVLLANGGEGNFGLPAGPVVITGNENFRGANGRGASLRFRPFVGPATILSFTPAACRSGYRMVASEGTLEEAPPTQLAVFHAAFRFSTPDVLRAYESWCQAGAVHHLALAPGHWANHLQQLSVQSGFDLVIVGEAQQ